MNLAPETRTETVFEVFIRTPQGVRARSRVARFYDEQDARRFAERNLYQVRDHADWEVVIARTVKTITTEYTEETVPFEPTRRAELLRHFGGAA